MHDWGCMGVCVARACVVGVHGGGCMVGGMMVGACMAGGMCGRGHAWQEGGYVGGMHGGRHACHACPPPWQILRLQHMVNERVVRILLEYILVCILLSDSQC